GGPPSGLGGPPSGLGGPPSGLGGPVQNGPPTGLGVPPSSSLSGPPLSGPGVGGSRPNLGRPQYARLPPQQTYPQSGFPSQPGQQPGFPPQPTGQQQPGFPPQPTGQSGFPPQPSGLQQPGFPPQPQSQSGFPPQPSAQPGFPPQPSGQPGFPPSQGPGQGFPQQNFPQQPGFPPMPSQQKFPPQQSPPGFPPQPGSGYPQQPGYPQGPGGYQQQQQEFSPPGMQYPNTRPQPTAQKKLDPDNMPSRVRTICQLVVVGMTLQLIWHAQYNTKNQYQPTRADGPPSNMPPLPVDPMKFSNIAPPVSSGVNFYGNNSSTLKQTSNFPPTSEPNSLLSNASAPSPLPSNLLGHHQQNLNAYLPPNQQNQSGKSSPNTAFGPNTTGPLNQFPPAQSNQNEAQSKPPSQEPLGDFQQQSARKSASPQQPGPNDNHDNGLNTSDPSPPVQRPPQSFTPNPNTQRPPSVHQEPDGAPAPNVQSPNTFSSSAFKPSTGGPFQPLKPSQPSFPPQQGDTSPSSIKSPGPQRNFPSGPQGFQPSQPGGENSFLQSPSQPQQSQSFSSPPKSEALPPSNSGGFAQMGSGDPASYPNQVSTPGPSFSSPPGAITSSSMSFTPSSGPSQGVSSPGFPTSAGNVQSPQQPPQSSQAGTQPPSGGLNGLPSGLRSSPLTGPPSGLSGPPLNGPPSFGGPQFNSPPSSLGGPNVGSPPQNRPPSSFGGPQSPPSSLVGPLQNGPPSTFGGPPQNRPPSSFGGPQISSPSSSLGGPPQNLGGPLQNGPPSSFGGPPQSGPPSTFGSPPQNRPPSSFGAPQMNNPSSSLGGPAQNLGGPLQNGPPSSFGGPPQNRPPSSFGGPQISSPSSSFGGPAQNLGGPLQNGPPSSFGGPSSRPPSSFSGPPSGLGGPPSGLGGPTLSGPPSSLGGPSTFGGAPQSGPPSSFPGPSSGLGGPPSGLGGPSSGLGGPPAGLGGPPSGLGGPPSGLGGPPSGLGGPTQNGPPTGLGAPPSSSLSGPPLSGPGVGGTRPNLGRPQYARPPPQQTYPQSGFPSQPGQQPGFPPQPTGQQQPGFPPQPTGQSGFPPQPSGLQQPGFPPQPQSQSGFPPQPSAQPGFPPQPSGQPGFPPSQGPGQGFPQQNFPQQPGFPPMPSQQKFPPQQSPPGFPPQPGSGYPQQPGYPQGPGGYQQQQQEFSPPGMQYPNTRPQPTAQKKLDPDNMPSRIQVMQDDRKSRSGEFRTDQRGGLPPLVTTPFTVQDQGNCSPRFVRSTMYSVPTTADLMKQVSVPFGLVISPLARVAEGEMEPPEADFSQSGGPVRCGRCKAYMAPFMQFVDGGRRFHCPMCKATTDVPETYFAHMDALGQRMDKYQRPELCLGSYELIVSEQYCRDSKFPNPPALIFILDVSYSNVKSGLVQLLCSRMAEILAELTNERLRVGFITYASSVHFYNIKVRLKCKLLVFNSSLPIYEAPGKLAHRDDRKMLGTDKEKTVLAPQNTTYNSLAQDCVNSGVSVDLFVFNNAYVDLATIGQVARLTGGQIYKYTYFQANVDGDRLIDDVRRNMSRPTAYDAVMRVRTSTGIRPTDFYGHMFMSNTTGRNRRKIADKEILYPFALSMFGDKLYWTDWKTWSIHVFDKRANQASLVKPELLEVTDVHEMFMPLLDGFLGTVQEAGAAIESLMEQIPALFQDTRETETLLLPAIQAGMEALKANDTTGKLLVFNSSLPIYEAPGKLAHRDDRKMLGTDKEKTVLAPQNTTYNSLAQDCVNSGVYHAPKIWSTPPLDTVLITTLFFFPPGVRKVRVHNLSLNCTAQMADIYRFCELDTLMNFFAKQCATKITDTTPRALRDALVTKTATILSTYRKNCASPGSSLGQLILPECLKLLPLYVNP
ncbi:collagen alpha-1(III) chain, partial [Diaphorina citri]|uniref:Collagen alpha-1(III) chain n=1 Tax=Diaphorina citri TaxID=121845 RepID=A0A3Q0J477_DIACI